MAAKGSKGRATPLRGVRRNGVSARLPLLGGISLLYGVFIGFGTLGNLSYWGLPIDGQSYWLAMVFGIGAGFAVPPLYFIHSRFLPAGATFKWFLFTLALLSILTGVFANAAFLIGHFITLPHEHAPVWTLLGLHQIFFTSATAELVFLTVLQRLALPFTPLALVIAATLFNRHFLMLHGLR